jgi:hypothetical protein
MNYSKNKKKMKNSFREVDNVMIIEILKSAK